MTNYWVFIPGCVLVSLSQTLNFEFNSILLIVGIITMIHGIMEGYLT